MKKLLLATKNQGKIREITALLAPLNVQVLSTEDIPLSDVEETGKTFTENALLKAHAGAKESRLPTLADDSGLCVEALGGAPGIYSARYGGIERLLKEMGAFTNRSAYFMCVLALVQPQDTGKDSEITFVGRSDGQITSHSQGEGGFGYDPVFIPQGDTRTYAQMTKEEKAKTSHRAKALAAFQEALKKGKISL